MKTKKLILPMVCCLPFLGSCSMLQTTSSETWGVNPVYSINKTAQSPDSLYQQGRYYQGQQRYEQAVNAYRKTLATDPTFVEARNGLGVIYAMQGRHEDAIKEFRAAITYAPDAAHLYNNLGHTLYLHGDYAAAVATLEHAVILAPGNPGTLSNLNLAYAKIGNPGYSPPSSVASTVPDNLPTNNTPLPTATAPAAEVQAQLQAPTQSSGEAVPLATPQRRLETVQLAPNIYEIRERTTLPPITTPGNKTPAATKPANLAALKLEVSNGNGVTGFARNVSHYLGKHGYKTARLTNQKPFQVSASQIQYRSGFRDEAQRLKSSLPGELHLVQNDKLRPDIQARVLLGKDATPHIAQFKSPTSKTVLIASNAPEMTKVTNSMK